MLLFVFFRNSGRRLWIFKGRLEFIERCGTELVSNPYRVFFTEV